MAQIGAQHTDFVTTAIPLIFGVGLMDDFTGRLGYREHLPGRLGEHAQARQAQNFSPEWDKVGPKNSRPACFEGLDINRFLLKIIQ